MATASVFERLESLLREHGAAFDVSRHQAVFTSEEAAAVRGTPLASGAKALIVKGDTGFAMVVLPADRRLAGGEVRKSLGWKKLRFASREEVAQLTGLEPGSIPPFGSLFGLATLLDPRLGDHERINFNAGDHTISISLAYADYRRVERPREASFAE